MTDRYGFNPDYYPSAPPNNNVHYPSVNPDRPCCPPSYPSHFPPQPHFPGPPHHGFPQPPHNHFPGHHQPFPPHPPSHGAPSFNPPSSHFPPPPGGSHVVKGYYWVATTARQGVPPTAVQGGVDVDGTTIYVGRAFHEGDWIPAKVIPQKDVAYVAYGGKEHAKSEFQVLCEQRFDWVPTSGSNIPPGAVEGGNTSNGEVLYVGRVFHNGSHTVGKVQATHGTCYIPFGGDEVGYPDYEILVLRG